MLYEKRNQTLLKITHDKMLVSAMNATKWRRLIDAISNLKPFEPEVRFKCINEDKVYGFSLVWWEEVYHMRSSIEWIDIRSIKIERVGRLVKNRETDYSKIISKALDEYNIPYRKEEEFFRITGYIKTN